MIVLLDRDVKAVLLKWLRQGFIDTLDLPQAYEGGNLFLEMLKTLPIDSDPADPRHKEQSKGI